MNAEGPDVTAARRAALDDELAARTVQRQRAAANRRERDVQGRFVPESALELRLEPTTFGHIRVTSPNAADWSVTVQDLRQLGSAVDGQWRNLLHRIGFWDSAAS